MRASATVFLSLVVFMGFVSARGAETPTPKNPFEGKAEVAKAGHSLFNATCAHCHGPDAVTGMSERNLRHLKLRYPDDMAATFYKTVTDGRGDKGMPSWRGALDDKTIWTIFTYLQTIQEDE